jgi:CubicO group peptidase (beta-lactamase class C family)
MNHTAIALTPWMKAHLALGHNAEGKVTPNWDLPTLAGAGALRSTMNDMLLFLRANLDPASSRLARVMQMTHQSRRPTSRPDMTIGLTWHIRRVDGDEVTWHNGGTGGYRTWIGFDAAHRTGAVVLTNSQESADDLGLALAKQKF